MISALVSRFSRLGGNLFGLLAIHLRLAGLELQGEVARVLVYMAILLVAILCGAFAVLLGSLLVIVIFWETHRIAAIASLFVFSLLLCAGLVFSLRNRLEKAQPLFSHLANELELDGKMFASRSSSHD